MFTKTKLIKKLAKRYEVIDNGDFLIINGVSIELSKFIYKRETHYDESKPMSSINAGTVVIGYDIFAIEEEIRNNVAK